MALKGLDAITAKWSLLKAAQRQAPLVALKVAVDHDHIIIDMNAEEQLWEQGITSDDVPIARYAPYSPVTIDIKKEKGQPTDRVTLRDEGDFHESFKVQIEGQTIRLTADDPKTGDLMDAYGKEIFGLTDANLAELREFYVMPGMLEYIKKLLQHG